MDLADELRKRLAPIEEVRLAVLFGSAAAGRSRPGSDVDVALLLTPYSPDLRGHVEAELYRAARQPIDTVLLDAAPPLLRFEITRGLLLLEREEGHWTRFKARAWVDWWDWAPLARQYNRKVAERLRGEAERASARLDEAEALFGSAPPGDLRSQDLASFYLFLAIQECIDLAVHWVADENWGPPEDAAASFEILVRRGVLDDELGERMIQAVGLRNRIAHGYATLDHERLRRELDRGAAALRGFLARVSSEAGL